MTPEKESSFPPTDGCWDRLLYPALVQRLRRRIEIVTYDSEVQATQPRVAHVEIEARGWGARRGYSFTIGYRFDGSNPLSPSSWSFCDAQRWNLDEDQKNPDRYEPKPVSREEIEKFLAKHNSSPEKVLAEYCQKLREGEVS